MCYDSPEVKAMAFSPELLYAEPAVFGKALALATLEGMANSYVRGPRGRKKGATLQASWAKPNVPNTAAQPAKRFATESERG